MPSYASGSSFWDPFGVKPTVIPWTDVILGDSQLKALLSNIKNWGNIEGLGNLFQNYILAAYNKAVPGFGSLLSGITGGTQTEIGQAQQYLEGQVPKDVMSAAFRTGAGQALGLQGPALTAALTNTALGTSQQMQAFGANLLGNASQRWGQLTNFAQGTMAPIQNMMITPQEQYTADLTNEINQQRTQQMAANIAAQPSPFTKGISDLVAYFTAAYLGHGQAGQPPAAPSYGTYGSVGSAQSAAQQALGQPVDWSNVGSTFASGGAATGGAGAGSSWDTSLVNSAAVPGSINNQVPLPDSSSAAPWQYGAAFGQPPTYYAPGGTGYPYPVNPDLPENY
jgi:hypothetical protein